jgi:hypothetical protein
MYKKRFTKWGFHKNAKRKTATDIQCVSVPRRKASSLGELVYIPKSIDFAGYDRTTLMILFNVRIWSASFFESTQLGGSTFQLQEILTEDQLRQFKTKEANFAFKLVVDLLERGHGVLAGRMARKAFLLAEDMLSLERPVLVWNLLEMMHYMVTGHAQLFQILLRHLIALACDVMPGAYPFIDMLRGMQTLVAALTKDGSTPTGSPTASSSSSAGDDNSSTMVDLRLQSSNLPTLLKQAWTINAEMILGNFDPRLFPHYFRIMYPTWDTCTIPAPARLVNAAKQWFCMLETQNLLHSSTMGQTIGHHAVRLLAYTLPKDDTMLESLLTPLTESLMGDWPQVYAILRQTSLAAVQEGRMSISGSKQKLDMDSTISLRMLAVLATAKIYESSSTCDDQTSGTLDPAPVATAIRTLIDLDSKQGGPGDEAPADTVERIRAIVTLRGYAEGETDPQVVREMWMLQDALTAAGRHEEAREVERDAYRRMEKYIEHIPVDSA